MLDSRRSVLDQPNPPLDVREFALGAAEAATAVLQTSNDLKTSAPVVQIRSTATGLLQAASISPDEALGQP